MTQLDHNHVAEAAKYVFNLFVTENGIKEAQFPTISPADLVRWLAMRKITLSPHTIANDLGERSSLEAAEFMLRLPDDPTGANRLVSMWPYLIMANRTAERKLRSFQIFAVLCWDDDVVCALSKLIHRDVVGQDITNADVAHAITTQPADMMNDIVEHGLDGLHAMHVINELRGSPGTIDLIRQSLNLSPQHFTTEQIAQIEALLIFFANFFVKEVPQHLCDEAAEVRKQNDEGPAGGWDS